MNCETIPFLLNAALDGELSSADRDALHQHLKDCPVCRALQEDLLRIHRDLTAILRGPKVEPYFEQIQITLRATGYVRDCHRSTRSMARSQLVVVAACVVLLFTVGAIFQWSGIDHSVGVIEMSTGTIDFKPRNSSEWIRVDRPARVSIPMDSRIRTRATSLCEIHTKSNAVVRLNHETELVLHRAEKVELISGELWCRASSHSDLTVCGAVGAELQTINSFTCPSSTEVQWKALPGNMFSCQDVASKPVEIKTDLANCVIEPGESLTFAAGQPVGGASSQASPLQATSWQLPLLVLRNPLDDELQARLRDMLALIGETKASYLYEDQIRQLGQAGAAPLIIYVRSSESRRRPSTRLHAMRLGSEMAAVSLLPDLLELANDEDPLVREMALAAIQRLQQTTPRPLESKS